MWCGCFCCLQIFPAADIIDWIDDGDTPLCPHCGMSSLLPDVTDLETLWRMRDRRFSGGRPIDDGNMSGH